MAIGLLASGNSGAVATNATTTVAVSVSAGVGNRKLLVGVTLEDATGNAAPASVTFNGQDLVALGLAVPGAANNQQSVCRTIFYEQFEGGMPAPGSHNIAVTWTATTGGAVVAYWLVDNVRQDQLATGGANGSNQGGSSGTTLTTSISADAASSFLASVGYRNNTGGTLQLTAPGSSTTRFDIGTATGGNRLSGGDKNGGLSVGANNATWTFSSTTDRRSMAVVVVNEVTAAALTASAAFTAQSASSDASAVVGHPASAAFTAQSATSLATLVRARQASAAFVAQSASSAAATVLGHPASAAFQAQSATSDAEVDVDGDKAITAAFQAQSATSAAAAVVGHPATAAFAAQPASSLATAQVDTFRFISAAFEAQPATSGPIFVHVPPPPPLGWNAWKRNRPRPTGRW